MSKQLVQVDLSELLHQLAARSADSGIVALTEVLKALSAATQADEQPQDKE